MRKLIFLLLLCGVILPGFSQNANIDEWEDALESAVLDTQKVMLLQKLSWEWKDQNLKKADTYIEEAIKLAKEINFIEGQAISFKTKGVLHWYRGEIAEAIGLFEISLSQYKEIGDKQGIANIYNNLGLAHQMMGDYTKAVDFLKEAFSIREEINDLEGIATSCNNLGVIYQMLGAYDYALNNHLRALEIRKIQDDSKNAARSLMNIGNVYAILEDHEKAMDHFARSLEIVEELSDTRGMADAYANLGENQFAIDSFDRAFTHYEKALDLRRDLEDQTGIRESLTDLGRVSSEKGDLKQAIDYHKQALAVAQEIEDKPAELNAKLFLGEALYSQKKLDQAEELLSGSLKLAEELETKVELSKAHHLLAELAGDRGKIEKALKHQIAYSDVKDAIFDEEKAQSLRRMQVVYETDKQKTQIASLEEDFSKAEFQKYGLLIFIVSLILAGLSWFLYYKYRSESRTAKMLYSKNKAIEFRNQQLAISNADLEQFAYVVSHDLKQPLRTIGSFVGLIERRYQALLDEEGKEYINYVTAGVKQMHKLLSELLAYSQLGKEAERELVDLNKVLSTSLNNLRGPINEEGAIITMDNLPLIMGNEKSQILLFENLIGNALKYSGDKRPEVEIKYEDMGNDHLISVKDNGIGIDSEYISKIFTVFQQLHGPEEFNGTGIGLAVCQKVVLQHSGEIWVESELGKGSTFFIRLSKDQISEEEIKSIDAELVLTI